MKRLNTAHSSIKIWSGRNPAELQATDYRELSDQPGPQYQHHYAKHGGIVAAAAGLFMLVMFVGSVGYVAGATYYHLQRMGGDTSVRR